MQIVIIEDEHLAAEKLERYLAKYDEQTQIVAQFSSIESAVVWFENTHNVYDVVFMDVQLTDGLSFEIFHRVKINKPVIFTTAFDHYAIQAISLKCRYNCGLSQLIFCQKCVCA